VRSLISRSVSAGWDVPPDAVAAAIGRAIDEERYEDAGHPTWSLWLVRGSVGGRRLDLVIDARSEPGRIHMQYPLALEVRGELVPQGTGTRLVGRATTPASKWDWPIAVGLGLVLAAPLLLFGTVASLAAFVLAAVVAAALYVALKRWGDRQYLAALPQVEAVLERVGTPATV